MSSVPNGGWPQPPNPANPGSSVKWRLLHSSWLLLPILGFSCLGGFGFLYVGLRARRPAWWIAGLGYLTVSWTAFAVVGDWGKKHGLNGWATGAVMAIWIASIVHACLINSSWLRWRASHVPWYAQPTAPPPSWPVAYYPTAGQAPVAPTSGVSLPSGMAPHAGAYYGPGPAVAPVSTPPQPVVPAPPPVPAAAPASQVDVNAATYDQLVALPGFHPERVQRVLAERQARRGFGSVEEFGAAANLAPHEFAPLRSLLVCAPSQQGPAGQWGQPPQGRVLDV